MNLLPQLLINILELRVLVPLEKLGVLGLLLDIVGHLNLVRGLHVAGEALEVEALLHSA